MSAQNVAPAESPSVVYPPNQTPAVLLAQDQPVVMSFDVATHFEKPHHRVLYTIKKLVSDLPEDFHESNFRSMFYEADVGNNAKVKKPAYELTRDGFTVLAMGFTGKKALDWKVRYIQAFNAMESRLSKGTPEQPKALPTATKEERRPLVDAVRTWVRLANGDYAQAHKQVNVVAGVSSVEQMNRDQVAIALAWVQKRIESVVDATEAKALAGADETMVAIERLAMIIKKVREVTKDLPVAMEVQLMRHILNKAGYPVD